jgi:hypothetical protein
MPDQEERETSAAASGGEGPVGDGEHVVRQGECLTSIAAAHGLHPDTIWNDAANAELKRKRKDPSVLLPGDRLHVPERRLKQESGATEQRHRFRRKGLPVRLILTIRQGGQPRADTPYALTVDGRTREGTTDGDGKLDEPIPAGAHGARLVVDPGGEDEQIFELDLGGLDPVTETAGVQKRLDNLGFTCESSGELDDQTAAALMAFQKEHDLEPTGSADAKTCDKLVQEHGS